MVWDQYSTDTFFTPLKWNEFTRVFVKTDNTYLLTNHAFKMLCNGTAYIAQNSRLYLPSCSPGSNPKYSI